MNLAAMRNLVSCCGLLILINFLIQPVIGAPSDTGGDTTKKNVWSAARDYYRKNAPVPVIYRGMRESHSPLRLAYEIPSSPNDIDIQRIPDLVDLPNLLLQQQKSRFKHQQEVFGSKISEPIRAYIANDYAYCDSLNNLTNEIDQNFMQVSKTGFKQYPSHVGLYKGPEVTEPSYLCGASWLNDQYLLTAASCLKDIDKASDLVAQFNEYCAFSGGHKSSSPSSSSSSTSSSSSSSLSSSSSPSSLPLTSRTIKREIASIVKFPEYSPSSDNHDLALLELKPLTEYNDAAGSIVAACQFNDRRSLHAKACWLPHRNITVTEFTDIEDLTFHQETKMTMMNQHVNLMVSDAVCQEQTGIVGFSSRHPNMLCSSDINIRYAKNKDTQMPIDSGSGIYCYEGGYRSLVAMVTPLKINGLSSAASSVPGFLDLNFYKPWIISITSRYG